MPNGSYERIEIFCETHRLIQPAEGDTTNPFSRLKARDFGYKTALSLIIDNTLREGALSRLPF